MPYKNPEDKRKNSKEYYAKKRVAIRAAQADYRSNGRGREYNLLRKYNISLADYAEMFDSQGGVCAICNRPPSEGELLHVDHCHNTDKVRGLLCGKCNRGLGLFDDNSGFLASAIEYLKGA